MDKEIVRLKGAGDGVKIYLSPNDEISAVTRALHDKLGEFRHFFGTGHCNIYFLGREFSKSDMTRLSAVAKTMLPESVIYYGERKREKTEQIEPVKQEDDIKPTIPVDEIREAAARNFKSSRARFYEGVVKSGRVLESDGHLILVGDVMAGGKLAAIGNIIVVGRLEGEAEAGCMGNNGAYVLVGSLEGGKIRIAGCSRVSDVSSPPKNGNLTKAYLINNEIFFDEFLLE